MTLVVENGTGLSTAESYLSAADFLTAALSYGMGYLNVTDQTSAWLLALQAAEDQSDVEAALRRGTRYLEGHYYDRWCGVQTTYDQALAWPRRGVRKPRGGVAYGGYGPGAGAFYSGASMGSSYRVPGQPSFGFRTVGGGGLALYGYGYTEQGAGGSGGAFFPDNFIPPYLLVALMQTALREYLTPGSLLPDYVASQAVQSESVGPVRTSYFNYGPVGNSPTLPVVDDALKPLLTGGGGATVTLARG